jgi:uncharacterized alpha-E superfamily protein
MKYHALLPRETDIGTPIDVAQWNALLRSASAYHGYRRVYPHEMTPLTVAGFILLDPRFPRSIAHCVKELRLTIADLKTNAEVSQVEFSPGALAALERLAAYAPDEVIRFGLHEFLDEVQVKLNDLGEAIDDTFFLARYSAS